MVEKAYQAARFGTERLKATYDRCERYVPAASFAAGMLFDIVTLGRIDDFWSLVLQAVYLSIVGLLLGLEVAEAGTPFKLPRLIAKIWPYRDEATHFFLGSLLSAFTIFYFKSSSFLGSFIFFVVIIACLVGNEFPALRRFGVSVRTVLFGVCVTSYAFCIVPMIFRRVGLLPFLTSLVLSLAMGAGFTWLLARRHPDKARVKREVMYPWTGMIAAFLVLYICRVIPPVPLSVKHFGIYRSVERVTGGYKVTHSRLAWRFWETGDQRFLARPGDKIYCFFSVFSPGGFQDRVQIRWLFRNERTGWQKLDAVPVSITGGRDAGFRGFSFKANYQPGDWQVRVETNDGLEIGRIYLSVAPAAPDDELDVHEELL